MQTAQITLTEVNGFDTGRSFKGINGFHLPGSKVFGAQPFQPRVMNINQVSSAVNGVLQGEIDNNFMSTKMSTSDIYKDGSYGSEVHNNKNPHF